MAAPRSRIETGSVQFGRDPPGAYFREDDAVAFGVHLGAFLERFEKGEAIDSTAIIVLRQLQRALLGASIDVGEATRQHLKPAKDCFRPITTAEADAGTIEILRVFTQNVKERQRQRTDETLEQWVARLVAQLSK